MRHADHSERGWHPPVSEASRTLRQRIIHQVEVWRLDDPESPWGQGETVVSLREVLDSLTTCLKPVHDEVQRQGADDGLWLDPRHASIGYVQQALRHLHRLIASTLT